MKKVLDKIKVLCYTYNEEKKGIKKVKQNEQRNEISETKN